MVDDKLIIYLDNKGMHNSTSQVTSVVANILTLHSKIGSHKSQIKNIFRTQRMQTTLFTFYPL